MRLYNNRTQQEEEIPNELVGNLVLSGSHSPYEEEDVPVINRNGDLEIIKGKNLGLALDNGWGLPDEEVAKAKKDSFTYDDKDGEAVAAAALRGFFGGVSDIALTKAFDVDPDHLSKLKEYNPYLNFVGEMGGITASLLIPTGIGAKAVSKVAGVVGKEAPAIIGKAADLGLDVLMPSRLLNRVNLGTQAITSKAMIKAGGITPASSLMAKGLATYVPKGIGSAVEGAGWGMNQLISEHALGDAEFSGENILAYTSQGAKWGGLLGAAIPMAFDGAVKSLLVAPKVIDKIAKVFGRNARIEDNKVEDFMKKPFDVPKDSRGNIIDRDEFAQKLSKTSEEFKKRLELGEIQSNEAKIILQEYEDIYNANSQIAKENLSSAKKILETKIKEEKQRIRETPIDQELVEGIKEIFVKAEGYRNQLSKEAFEILESTPNVIKMELADGKWESRSTKISTKNVVNYIKTILGDVDEGTNGLPLAKGEAQQKYFNLVESKINLFKEYGKKHDYISPPEVKSFIQAIDDDIRLKGGWWVENPEINFLKNLRFYLDSRIKEVIPEYQAKMLAVKEMTEILKSIRRQYGKSIKQLTSDSESIYFDDDAIKSKLISIAKNLRGGRGLIQTMKDAEGYLPEKTGRVEQVQKRLGQYIQEFQLAYGTGLTAEKRVEELISKDPQLSGLATSIDLLTAETELYTKGRQFLKRNPDQVIKEEVVNNLESLKNVVEQREKYQKSLEALKQLKEDYKIWQDVATPEEALNKLSQWESKGKKSALNVALLKKQESLKKFMKEITSLSEEDFTDIVNTLRLEAAFDKTATNGARSVGMWSLIIGGATGGLTSPNTPMGIVLGAFFGGMMDLYSPRVTKSILTALSKTKDAITIERLNKVIKENLPKDEGKFNDAAMASLSQVEKINQDAINRIRFSVSDYIGKPLKYLKISGIKYSVNDYEKEKEKLKKIINVNGIVNSNFHSNNEFMYLVAPSTTESYYQTYNRAVGFIQNKFPQIDRNDLDNFYPSDSEKLKFIRYMRFVEDPYLVIDSMKNGVIYSDGIEVLKDVYPSIYKVLDSEVAREITRINPKNISVEKKSDLTREFGYKFTYTNSPMVFNILQKPSSKKEEANKQSANINLKSKAGGRSETVMNRIQNRV